MSQHYKKYKNGNLTKNFSQISLFSLKTAEFDKSEFIDAKKLRV
jgi:hypothetical protein